MTCKTPKNPILRQRARILPLSRSLLRNRPPAARAAACEFGPEAPAHMDHTSTPSARGDSISVAAARATTRLLLHRNQNF